MAPGSHEAGGDAAAFGLEIGLLPQLPKKLARTDARANNAHRFRDGREVARCQVPDARKLRPYVRRQLPFDRVSQIA